MANRAPFFYGKPIQQVFLGGNITLEEFQREKAGDNKIPDNDIMWGLLNKRLNEFMLKSNWQEMKLIYLDMANFLRVEGKGFFNVLKASQKCALMTLKLSGIKSVKILACTHAEPFSSHLSYNSCEACSKLNNTVFAVDEALKIMPLPVKDCEFSIYGCKKGWCRCLFIPEN